MASYLLDFLLHFVYYEEFCWNFPPCYFGPVKEQFRKYCPTHNKWCECWLLLLLIETGANSSKWSGVQMYEPPNSSPLRQFNNLFIYILCCPAEGKWFIFHSPNCGWIYAAAFISSSPSMYFKLNTSLVCSFQTTARLLCSCWRSLLCQVEPGWRISLHLKWNIKVSLNVQTSPNGSKWQQIDLAFVFVFFFFSQTVTVYFTGFGKRVRRGRRWQLNDTILIRQAETN